MQIMSHSDPVTDPEVLVAHSTRLFCDGDERGGDGHPRVWLQIGEAGFVECGYCDRRFVLAAGADTEAGH